MISCHSLLVNHKAMHQSWSETQTVTSESNNCFLMKSTFRHLCRACHVFSPTPFSILFLKPCCVAKGGAVNKTLSYSDVYVIIEHFALQEFYFHFPGFFNICTKLAPSLFIDVPQTMSLCLWISNFTGIRN